jgi:hypothetical protein
MVWPATRLIARVGYIFGLDFFWKIFGSREAGRTVLSEVEFGRTQLETARTGSRLTGVDLPAIQPSLTVTPCDRLHPLIQRTKSAGSLQRPIVTVPKITIIRTVMAGNREIAQ